MFVKFVSGVLIRLKAFNYRKYVPILCFFPVYCFPTTFHHIPLIALQKDYSVVAEKTNLKRARDLDIRGSARQLMHGETPRAHLLFLITLLVAVQLHHRRYGLHNACAFILTPKPIHNTFRNLYIHARYSLGLDTMSSLLLVTL
jgi:hypothetical protein